MRTQDEKLIFAFISNGMLSLIKTWLMEDIGKTPKEIADILFERILPKVFWNDAFRPDRRESRFS